MAEIKVNQRLAYTFDAELIDSVVVAALEGGINYWCSKATPKNGNFCGAEYGSGVLTRGGALILVEDEDGTKHELTLEKLIEGLKKAAKLRNKMVDVFLEEHDAVDADLVIQYAIFGEVIYG